MRGQKEKDLHRTVVFRIFQKSTIEMKAISGYRFLWQIQWGRKEVIYDVFKVKLGATVTFAFFFSHFKVLLASSLLLLT